MTEYTVKVDEAHELMLDEMTGDDSEMSDILSGFLEQSIYNTYQQVKQAESE